MCIRDSYESSRAMSMAGENVPGQVYDNLVATVRKHLPDMYRYVALRKRIDVYKRQLSGWWSGSREIYLFPAAGRQGRMVFRRFEKAGR